MGRCFLRFLIGRILLIAGLGPLIAELRINSSSTQQQLTTNSANFPSSASTLIIASVNALSGTSSSPRRPPRIRPKRQSPTPPSENASYGGDDRDANNNDNNNNNDNDNDNDNNFVSRKHEQALNDPSLLTGIRFSDRTDLHPHTKEALVEGFGLQTMTRVQADTYEAAREGRSVLARSKTGSGKTLAFLLPTLERLLDPDFEYIPGRSIGCVVLAPTRELAIQIADQAELLVGYHNKHRRGKKALGVACIYGGVKMQRDVRLLTGDRQGGGMGDLPTILVATPARLLEHLEGNSPLNKNFRSNGNIQIQSRKNKSKFASVVAETKIVVLDETDRLLQKSNQYETQRILSFMARADKRQTLLFSATFPRAVRRLVSNSSILNKKKKQTSGESYNRNNNDNDNDNGDDFFEVDCIGNEDIVTGGNSVYTSSTDVHSADGGPISTNQKRVEESFVGLEHMSQFIPSLLTILRREQQRDHQNYKILVFFPAGRLVRFLFQFFTIGGLEGKENLWEIHSRMSQSSRTRASSSFRTARRGILFSSDVSARGLDYPDVSLVVQMGAPSSDHDYIHRIGRTGRAGKIGRGLLVFLPFERDERNEQRNKQDRGSSNTRRSSSGTVSYRNDANLKEDRQMASWLSTQKEPEIKDDNQNALSSETLYQRCKNDLESIRLKVRSGHVVLTPGAEAAYKTFLAHYVATSAPPNRKKNGSHKGGKGGRGSRNALPPSEVLAYAKDFVEGTGLSHTPELDDEFATKLGLQQ